jgi:hypothetical protein
MDTLTVIGLIAVGILTLPLLYVVHITLQRIYLAYVQRFCRKRGLTVSQIRATRCSECVLVELDCLDHEQRRRLVRLLVWVFGIRAVLSIEDFSDEPPSHAPEGTKGLMTREQFFSSRQAWNREDNRLRAICLAVFVALACAVLLSVSRIDNASGTVQGVYGSGIIAAFGSLLAAVSWRAKRLLGKYGLKCRACRKALVGDPECERVVASTGRCWRCGAWALTAQGE